MYKSIRFKVACIYSIISLNIFGQQANQILSYQVEAGGITGKGVYAPLWFTSNRYGYIGNKLNSIYLRTDFFYNKKLKNNWQVNAGFDIQVENNNTPSYHLCQLYTTLTWKALNFCIGQKEYTNFPLSKNNKLSSGMLVEGANTRPIPQIRVEIADFINTPGTKGWLGFKGHLAYGKFTEGNWQKDFVKPGSTYVKDVLYHSKSLMLRLGNKNKLPIEFEFGILMAAQFGGDKYIKYSNGTEEKVLDMPNNFNAYWKAFFPQAGGSDTPYGEQTNIEGNQVGSWNFALNYYHNQWKFKVYLEHYFEDHSQMFWEYGRWKDGQIGLEITLPNKKWVSSILWEGMNTTNQSGPILYNSFEGQFPEYQISGADEYFNHYIYGAWQYYGMGMGNALIPGPLYNDNHSITFRSNRVRSQHFGLEGNPFPEWNYRILLSYSKYWGTYYVPLEKVKKQFNSLIEWTYTPKKFKGWSGSVAMGLDRGNYLGNSTGGMLSIKKIGSIF